VRLYFVRHGESEANVTRTFANWGAGYPLTETGAAQARELADLLHPEGITHLYASPVLRARQTAELLSERLGCPVQVTHCLREFDVGRYEGTSGEAGWREYDDVVRAWGRGDSHRRVDYGESMDDMRLRFVPFVREVLEHGQPEDRVVLVSHGGLYLSMLPLVLANVAAGYAMQHVLGHTACIVAESRDAELVCVDWCGSSGPFG
jgi:probable phosphoglycerate mutase